MIFELFDNTNLKIKITFFFVIKIILISKYSKSNHVKNYLEIVIVFNSIKVNYFFI